MDASLTSSTSTLKTRANIRSSLPLLRCLTHCKSKRKTVVGIKDCGIITGMFARTKFDQFIFVQKGSTVLLMDHGACGEAECTVGLVTVASRPVGQQRRLQHRTSDLFSHGRFCECMVHNRHLLRKQLPCADPLRLGLDSTASHCRPGRLS